MDKQIFESLKNKHKNLFSVFILVLTLFLSVLIIYAIVGIQNQIKKGKYVGREFANQNTITLSETGEVYAKPDLALTDFSVVTEAKTVAQALKQGAEKMNAVIDFIKKQGVADKDLKTVGFNISPRYEWLKENPEIYPEGKRVLTGYEVYQSLEVKIRDLEKTGQIIEGSATAGANQIGDLQFTIDKEEELKQQARAQAIEKVQEKARELSSQLGVKLVRISNFNESGGTPRYYALEKMAPNAAGGGAAEAPVIQTGENKIEVTVNITYIIE